ncbi:MAG: hypothetical protein JNK46_11355 [Methylobacteriaceae bacterium]|nr:hypothetical protein [Methylobacteriaceae bacterium]
MIVPSIVKAGLGMIAVAGAVIAGAALRPATDSKVAAETTARSEPARAEAGRAQAKPEAAKPQIADEARRKLDEALRAGGPLRASLTGAEGGLSAAPRAEPEATRSLARALAVSPRPEAANEADDLCERARKELADGAVASARALLTRAARGGAPRALHMLAESYDPAALGEQGLPTARSDAARARSLYERAAAAGWADAQRRLAALSR